MRQLISDPQCGFRKKPSTGHVILHLIEETLFELDKGKYCAAVLIDFASRIWLCQPEHLAWQVRPRGFSSGLLGSHFSDRLQFVDIGGTYSEKLPVRSGIPKGSCIGPLAFLCYIKDLATTVTFRCIMYADDTTLRFVGRSLAEVQSHIEADLKLVSDWCAANVLSPNVRKAQIIVFKSGRADEVLYPTITMGPVSGWQREAVGRRA